MTELLNRVEQYWKNRSDGYSKVNIGELQSFKRKAWIELIHAHSTAKSDQPLKVLDIGTGPGFFAIIMASCGHQVTALDYTDAMLEKAKSNAAFIDAEIDFHKMDAHELSFEDGSFDLIITRNLTWNLENPAQAYKEWHRVLSQGGRIMNFDANWYHHLFYPEKRVAYEQDRINAMAKKVEDHYAATNTIEMEDIARKLPLSKIDRPEWDIQQLRGIGFKDVTVKENIGELVWDQEEQVNYRSTPMFMVVAEK